MSGLVSTLSARVWREGGREDEVSDQDSSHLFQTRLESSRRRDSATKEERTTKRENMKGGREEGREGSPRLLSLPPETLLPPTL